MTDVLNEDGYKFERDGGNNRVQPTPKGC